MGTKQIVGLVLVVLGAVLLYFGWQATDAPLERASKGLTGEYSDRTMQYLIGGGVAAAAGIGLFLAGRKR